MRFFVTSGYWFSNGFTKYVKNCPLGHCDSTFDSIYDAYESNVPLSNSNDQCSTHWTGLALGECVKDNFIMHNSTNCVPSRKCTHKSSSAVILFSLLHCCTGL